jgi:hypothetical protein
MRKKTLNLKFVVGYKLHSCRGQIIDNQLGQLTEQVATQF